MADILDIKAAFLAEAAADDQAIEVVITDRSGEPYADADGKPAVLFVLGQYSSALREFDKAETKRAIRSMGYGAEQDGDRWVHRLAAAITDWRIAIGGQEVPFTHENAATILKSAPWLCEQVARATLAPRRSDSEAEVAAHG